MKHFYPVAAAFAACLAASPALAAPGLGGEIYGANVEKGETEAELRWDTLAGGPDDGEDVLKLEMSHGLTDRLQLGAQLELEKEPGLPREAEALGLEAIYELGSIGGIAIAAYGEYEIVFDGADKVETKLLVQHKSGPLDIKFNLIAEKRLQHGAPVELAYAASADVEAFHEVRLGVMAFGELGTFRHIFPNTEHFAGPFASVEIEGLGPELELSAGYLFALGTARRDTDGQVRLALEVEF